MNARLKTNGDQSSSAIILTDAIIEAEVITAKTGSIPTLLLVGRLTGPSPRGFNVLNVFDKALCSDHWIIVAASRVESARNFH